MRFQANAISEADLAIVMADRITVKDRYNKVAAPKAFRSLGICNLQRQKEAMCPASLTNTSRGRQVLPVGGPGEPVTPLQQSQILFDLFDKEPKYIRVRPSASQRLDSPPNRVRWAIREHQHARAQ